MTNKYKGKCSDCGKSIPACEGILEATGLRQYGKRYKLWCETCFDRSDNSSYEDRACGDRAYEDQCYNAVNY